MLEELEKVKGHCKDFEMKNNALQMKNDALDTEIEALQQQLKVSENECYKIECCF